MTSADRLLARRWSRALCAWAEASGRLGEVHQELQDSLRGLSHLRALLAHPLVPVAQKKARIGEALGPKCSRLALKALELLVEKKRWALLPAIVSGCEEILDEKMGVLKAQVRTAFALERSEEEKLKKALKSATGKEIVMEVKEDPALIGGFVVRVGGRVLDRSFSGALARLKESWEGASHGH